MRSFEMTEVTARGLDAVLDEAFELATDGCDAVFVSVDVDVVDPGSAPGTGTPEPGGLTSRQLLDAVRRIGDGAAGRRARRRRGLAALRHRRDHRLPRQPRGARGPVGDRVAARAGAAGSPQRDPAAPLLEGRIPPGPGPVG